MAFENSHATGFLPCLRLGADRWWLPLSPGATEILGRAMVMRSAASGDRGAGSSAGAVIDEGLLAPLISQLQQDPPLLVYAALASSVEEIDLLQLARWLVEHVVERFSSGDAFLGTPRITGEHRRRWRELDGYFRTLPFGRWCREAALWLEVTGPPVPAGWREQWPQAEIDGERDALAREPDAHPEFPSPAAGSSLLPMLARSLAHKKVLERDFDEELKRQKLGAVEQLAYGLSHEINNPLANISTRAQHLLSNEADPQRAATLQRIVDQVYRAHEMIADLMFYANPPAPSLARCDLGEIAEAAARGFQTEAERQSIRLEFDQGPGRTEVDADGEMLGEAIRVLIRNSIEAVGTQGTVVVRVDSNHDGPRVHVADSGPGLSEKARLHAFDPYFSGREAGRGLGLGLCRAYRIATLHGGDVRLTSGPAGCVATLSLQSPHGRSAPITE